MTLGHSHASMAATLAYSVLKPARKGSGRPARVGKGGAGLKRGEGFPLCHFRIIFIYFVLRRKYQRFIISPDRGPLRGMRSIGKAMGKIKEIVLYRPESVIRLESYGYCHTLMGYYIFRVETSL